MNNKKFASYKDYKYVYTGYKDYLEKHKLDKENINKKVGQDKEYINHDHNYSFDFNNPNEHQHDYSFEFDKNKQYKPHEKNKSDEHFNYSGKTDNQHFKEINNNYSNVDNKYTYSFEMKRKRLNKNKKIFLFFIIIIVLGIFLSIIFRILNDLDEYSINNYNSEYEYDYDYGYNYNDPIDAYCSSLENYNYTLIDKYIIDKANITKWHDIVIKDRNITSTCNSRKIDILSVDEIENIEKKYKYLFDDDIIVYDSFKITIYDDENKKINITIANINDYWYLIDHNTE